MTQGKHTPGPWEWVKDKSDWGGTWIFSGDTPVLDYAGCGSHDTEISDANAHLISAAPDMLEALREVVSEYDNPDNGRYLRWAVDDARAAIAKATGDTK